MKKKNNAFMGMVPYIIIGLLIVVSLFVLNGDKVEVKEISTGELITAIKSEKIEENCKFTGCTHLKEPGCSIKAAVEEGLLHPKRYESYQYFYDKLRDNKFWKIGKEE